MPYDDLRSYLDALDLDRQLRHLTEELDPAQGPAEALRAAAELGDHAPGLYLDNLHGLPEAQLTLGLLGSWTNHAIALGLPPTTPLRAQIEEFGRRWHSPVGPVTHRADPAWDEYVLTGTEVDLAAVLPLFELGGDEQQASDRAPVLAALPGHRTPDLRLRRFEPRSRNRLALRLTAGDPLAHHPRQADLPVALALGTEPMLTVAAATVRSGCAYTRAAALRGAPCPVTTGPLTGFEVPWGCEALLEGVLEARAQGATHAPVVRIDRISHRASPIFDSLRRTGEHLTGPAACVRLLDRLRADFPDVRAVNSLYGDGRLAIVALTPRHPGLAEAVTARCHGLAPGHSVITVSGDVDPFDLPQVLGALAAGPALTLDTTRPAVPV
ncbi:UbiD family decarboxylase domain-containing protein [Kitasatospora sp. NPDC002227]|uniref:UbiD family decarboxylase domain-containing protein n=1 Tax=Kitasatospora sp. NPDC002227 TaxID=3154773 RepID=UPI00331DCA7B